MLYCCSECLRSTGMRPQAAFFLLATIVTIAMNRNSVTNALSAPPSSQKSNNWLVVDFDGTCTVRDTITMLPRLASLAQSRVPSSSEKVTLNPDAVMDFHGRLSIFSMLEDEYFRKYTQAMESIVEPIDSNKEEGSVLLEELSQSIDKLDEVSTEITHEVSNWRVLGGLGDLDRTEMLQLIEIYKEKQMDLEPKKIKDRETNHQELLDCLALKQGCLDVLLNCSAKNYGIGVLSINWCPMLIESLLVHPLCDTFGEVPIWSNSVNQEGIVALPFPGAIAKQDQILKLQQENQGRVVYVGDSSTDLLAILQADVGILLGGSQSAASLAQKHGVIVKPLSEYDGKNGKGIVWTANHWDEIGDFLDQT